MRMEKVNQTYEKPENQRMTSWKIMPLASRGPGGVPPSINFKINSHGVDLFQKIH